RANEALKFSALINEVDLETVYAAGLPDAVHGVIRQANIRGEGSLKQPNISGTGTIQNLSIHGEVYPQAEVELASIGSRLDDKLNTGTNINVTAQLDTAATGYPFTAQARFKQYPVERLARVPGTVTATGNVSLSGLLTDW